MSLRVFAPAPLARGEEIVLDADESHYLTRVRRAGPGDALDLLDGEGGVAQGELVAIEGKRCRVRVGSAVVVPASAPLVLVLGLPDVGAALEAITVACELGATRVVLARCARTSAPAPTRERIARVVRAAQRQCGIARPPELVGPLALALALERADDTTARWVATPRAGEHDTRSPPGAAVALLVGPEGGLAPAEETDARTAGFAPISLGPWTLRTPTAVAAGLALVRAG